MNLVSVFCRQISSFPTNICLGGCLFSIVCFWNLCQKLGGRRCVDSYPGPLFCSIRLHMFLWHYHAVFIAMALWYSSKSGIMIGPVLLFFAQFCLRLFMVFCVSKWSSGLIFQSLWWMSLGFWWELCWTCRLLLVVKPFLLCWFCQSLSIGDLSTFCSLPQSFFNDL
jgi:hypothetical protein